MVEKSDPNSLRGLVVANTRPTGQVAPMDEAIKNFGGSVFHSPLVEVIPRPLPRDELESLREWAAGGVDAVVFCSANGVAQFFSTGLDSLLHPTTVTLAIGPATARALKVAGVGGVRVPSKYSSIGLLETWSLLDPLPRRVLLPGAGSSGNFLARSFSLKSRDVETKVVRLYSLKPSTGEAGRLWDALGNGLVQVLPFTCPAAVAALASVDRLACPRPRSNLSGVLVAAIGPATADSLKLAGFPVDLVADDHTIAGLVESIALRFKSGRTFSRTTAGPRTKSPPT
ncbi:MAG: hypothetical protein Kow0069_30150 [Promethearchaeota archaeon]